MPALHVKRRFTRFPIVLPLRHQVEGRSADKPENGWTRDLSGGGACVELAARLQLDMPLRLVIRMDQNSIEVVSRVIWRGDPPRVEGGTQYGIAFRHLPPDQLETLGNFLLSLRQWRHARGRLPSNLAVTCRLIRFSDPPIRGKLGNVSRGGIMLRLPVELPPSTDLEVSLSSPTRTLTLAATIAWVEPRERRKSLRAIQHGVRFPRLDWSTSLALAHMLTDQPDGPQPLRP
ncbi:MAG TPA: PilZ domain-containing protein [Candidatus Methylomirabilis sp.]|nr:PilZ domain-containing protein [Candidatus Methylomirabilis sp.]